MSDLPFEPRRFDAPLATLVFTPRTLLGMALIFEQAAHSYEREGADECAATLWDSAAVFRRQAVDV